MTKGDETRRTILDHALAQASRVGLEGITIGQLAEELDLSKSGLFAHFRSKEALSLAILDHASERFTDKVIRPALKAPRGEPRLRELFDRWCRWPEESGLPGGCFFVPAMSELDDRPGPARDRLVAMQRDLVETLATVVRGAITEKHFRTDTDPEQMAQELYALVLALHLYTRLLQDPKARRRTKAAFEKLVTAAKRAA